MNVVFVEVGRHMRHSRYRIVAYDRQKPIAQQTVKNKLRYNSRNDHTRTSVADTVSLAQEDAERVHNIYMHRAHALIDA